MNRLAPYVLALTVVIPGGVVASSSPPVSAPSRAMSPKTPEQDAVEEYNDGVADREQADKLERESAAESDPAKKAKLLAKSRSKHEASIKRFTRALGANPKMVQAWGSLGYAYRKVGNYPSALEAYDKALALQPTYTPAVEYRAEAYLGLNRLTEAKSAYMTLFNADRARADELEAAMEKWVEARKIDPAGVDPATLEDFARWLAERKQLASQTSSLRDPMAPRW